MRHVHGTTNTMGASVSFRHKRCRGFIKCLGANSLTVKLTVVELCIGRRDEGLCALAFYRATAMWSSGWFQSPEPTVFSVFASTKLMARCAKIVECAWFCVLGRGMFCLHYYFTQSTVVHFAVAVQHVQRNKHISELKQCLRFRTSRFI